MMSMNRTVDGHGPDLVRQWRESQTPKVSQRELGERCGIDGSSIRHYEIRRHRLTVASCLAVSRETGLPLSQILQPGQLEEARALAAGLASEPPAEAAS